MLRGVFLWAVVSLFCFSGLEAYRSQGTPEFLYKIVSVEQWQESQGQPKVKLSSMDENFIHLATEEQVDRIVKKFWSDVPAYLVLKVATERLQGKLVLEANPWGINKYYHLYHGSIPMDTVVDVRWVNQAVEKCGIAAVFREVLDTIVAQRDLRAVDAHFTPDFRFHCNGRMMPLHVCKARLLEAFQRVKHVELPRSFKHEITAGDQLVVQLTLLSTDDKDVVTEVEISSVVTFKGNRIYRWDGLAFPDLQL